MKKLLLITLLFFVPLQSFAFTLTSSETGTVYDRDPAFQEQGKGFELSGEINLNDTTALDSNGGRFAIAFWYKSSVTETNVGIFDIGDYSGGYDIALIKNNTDWQFRCASLCSATFGDYVVPSLDDGNWHFIVAGIIPSAGEMYFYADGVYVEPLDTGYNLVESSGVYTYSTLHVGGYYTESYRSTFDVDDLMVFNDELTESYITELYNSGSHYSGITESTTGIFFYDDFNFTDPPATSTLDLSYTNYLLSIIASSTATTSNVMYGDWLIMNLWILFFLSLIGLGFFFQLFRKRTGYDRALK